MGGEQDQSRVGEYLLESGPISDEIVLYFYRVGRGCTLSDIPSRHSRDKPVCSHPVGDVISI